MLPLSRNISRLVNAKASLRGRHGRLETDAQDIQISP